MAVTLSRRAVDTLDSRLWHHLALGVHPACAIAAYKDGELVIDLFGGDANPATGLKVTRDTLYNVWSCGKPLAAACLWVLKDRGVLGWDDRVTDYWPEYGAHGKGATTIRHVLTHQAGVPDTPQAITDFDRTRPVDRADVVAAMESAELKFKPGTAIEYHSMTFGWLVAELASRASGRPFPEFLPV